MGKLFGFFIHESLKTGSESFEFFAGSLISGLDVLKFEVFGLHLNDSLINKRSNIIFSE
jgi:hypothetical protein